MRALGWIMSAAAAYDVGFGIAILGFARPTADLLGVPLPPDPVYLRLVGILLLVLGALYVLPARDPVRFAPVVAVSAAGRLLGAAYLAQLWVAGKPPAFLGLAGADLGFAVVQAVLLLRARAAKSS